MLYSIRYNELRYDGLLQKMILHKDLRATVSITGLLYMCSHKDFTYIEILEVINEDR